MLAALAFVTVAQSQSIDPVLAAKYFQQAKSLSTKDGGKLWGMSIDGPMFFADRQTHEIVANQPDAQGALTKEGDVFIGKLPNEINIANNGIDWSGKRWTMIAWPLSDLPYTRGRLLMHESFHRIQPALGFHFIDLPSEHLDSLNGRVWLRLEMRALAEALLTSGEKRTTAVHDAILFRKVRRHLCGDQAAQSEQALELNEGLAEYTGYKLCGLPDHDLDTIVATRLNQEQSGDSFSRSFCYATGPAIGLLLDDAMPDWRKSVTKGAFLDDLLEKAPHAPLPNDLEAAAKTAALNYDGDRVIPDETERDTAHQQRIAAYKTKFVDGPVVIFKPGNNFGFGFDPNAVDSFPNFGSVYNGARVTDDWGVLEATGDVLFIRANGLITEVRVPVTTGVTDPPVKGDGWTLQINAGWKLVPGDRKGDWMMTKSQ